MVGRKHRKHSKLVQYLLWLFVKSRADLAMTSLLQFLTINVEWTASKEVRGTKKKQKQYD